MNTYKKTHISQVIELFKLTLVLPATNASSERSFSLLLIAKSYLLANHQSRSTKNYLMILSAYKGKVDELNLKDVARELLFGKL